MNIVILTKICPKCETEYPATLEYFPPRKNRASGFHSWCRNCNRMRYRAYNVSGAGQRRSRCYEQTRPKRYNLAHNKRYRETINGYLHHVFSCMNQRCNNTKVHNYHRYGGRGIKIMFGSSAEFVAYVVKELNVDPRGLQIDRIDNNGNYEPGNIRFVTPKENCNNRENSK